MELENPCIHIVWGHPLTNLFREFDGGAVQQHSQYLHVALESSQYEWSLLTVRLRVRISPSIQEDCGYLMLLPIYTYSSERLISRECLWTN